MHALITGGSGFLGRALCRALLDDGHHITVLTRSATRAAKILPQGVTAVESLESVTDVDAVFNLAGENLAAGRWTDTRKRAFRESRIVNTNTLLQWMQRLERRPDVLVSASAIGYYGPRGDEAVHEDTPPGDDFAAVLCRDWEAAAAEARVTGRARVYAAHRHRTGGRRRCAGENAAPACARTGLHVPLRHAGGRTARPARPHQRLTLPLQPRFRISCARTLR